MTYDEREQWETDAEQARGDQKALDALQFRAMRTIEDPDDRRLILDSIANCRNPSRVDRFIGDIGLEATPGDGPPVPDDGAL